jgi:hypothetical protein
MSNGGIAIAPKVRNPTMRPPPAGYDPTFVAPKVRNPTMRPPPAGYDPTFVAPKVRNPTMRYGRQQPRQPTNPTARQPAGWNGGDWRQGYTPPGGSRWSDRLRQGNGNTSSGRSSQIRDWISQRVRSRGQEQTWRDEMLANTGPADRQQAQQWIRDHPGETMEGTYNPNTWQYAAQQYQNRPGPGSLWDLPAFQRYRDKYGITPPGPGHMRV